MIRVYNTRTRTIEDFNPPKQRVNLFVCGPTVYDSAHIGHARTYIFFDVLAKFLKSEKVDLFYLQNITDIDDKIIHRAKELGIDPLELSRKESARYLEDMKTIKVTAVNEYAKASDHISEIISQIERLISKKHAYESQGSVYFDISTFPNFGTLSHQNLEALQKAPRTEEDTKKKHEHDFVLWRGRSKDSGEPVWESPWGPGRPGWHIEDTAITEKSFKGPQYDIHGGGIELMFPHHEAEIAQMESISGISPLAQLWIHVGWLTVKGEKMSKSLGNFIRIEDILKKYSPEALRLLVLQTHYRSPLEYSEESIQAAENAIENLHILKARLEIRLSASRVISMNTKPFPFDSFRNSISEALSNDFNTVNALAHVFEFIKSFNEFFENADKESADKALRLIDHIESIFGIIPTHVPVPEAIQKLATKREGYRINKEWEKSDTLRKEIEKAGYHINDTPDGPVVWKNR